MSGARTFRFCKVHTGRPKGLEIALGTCLGFFGPSPEYGENSFPSLPFTLSSSSNGFVFFSLYYSA